MKPHISKLTQEDALQAARESGIKYINVFKTDDNASLLFEFQDPEIIGESLYFFISNDGENGTEFYLNTSVLDGVKNPHLIMQYLTERYDFSNFANTGGLYQKNASEFNLQTAQVCCTTKQYIKAVAETNDIVYEEAKSDIELIDKVVKQFIQSTSTLPQIGMEFVFGSGVFAVKSIRVELHSNLIYIKCKIKENNIAQIHNLF